MYSSRLDKITSALVSCLIVVPRGLYLLVRVKPRGKKDTHDKDGVRESRAGEGG